MWSDTDRTLHPSHAARVPGSELQPLRSTGAGGEGKEAWEGDWDDERVANGW